MNIDQQAFAAAAERAARAASGPVRVLLFGSCAYGQADLFLRRAQRDRRAFETLPATSTTEE